MEQISESMFSSLGGQRTVGQSMFESVRPQVGPTAEELEQARERVMFKKVVEAKGYHVKLFNMHDPKQIKAYEKLMGPLILGVQAQTHKIFVNELQVLTTLKGMQWHRYVEWMEFNLRVEPTAPTAR